MDYLPSFSKFKNRQPSDSEHQTPRIDTSRKTSTSSLQPSPRSSLHLSPRPSLPASPTPSLPQPTKLPPTHPALEGHLNHHASQLQRLADRAEMINEWIDMDGIVLARLKREVERTITTDGAVGSSDKEREGQEGKEGREGKEQGGKEGKEEEERKKKKKKMVETHNGIREIQERIAGMRRWRKEVERAVVWQREEGWRVEKAMGRGKGRERGVEDADVDGGGTGGGGGGGERRWSVRGKVPSQREWEGIFCRD